MKTSKANLKPILCLLVLLLMTGNKIFPAESERDKRLAMHEKNRNFAKEKCGTSVPLIVQLNRGGTVTGVCLFFFGGIYNHAG